MRDGIQTLTLTNADPRLGGKYCPDGVAHVLLDASDGDVSVALGEPRDGLNTLFLFERIDATANAVAVIGTGVSVTLTATGQSATVVSDAAAWHCLYSGGTGGVLDHGGLAGLDSDDHTQYPLLAGRAGGQSLVGGTASGDVLVLQATSHADGGSIIINNKDGTPAFTMDEVGEITASNIADYFYLPGRSGGQVGYGGTGSGESVIIGGSAHANGGPVIIERTPGVNAAMFDAGTLTVYLPNDTDPGIGYGINLTAVNAISPPRIAMLCGTSQIERGTLGMATVAGQWMANSPAGAMCFRALQGGSFAFATSTGPGASAVMRMFMDNNGKLSVSDVMGSGPIPNLQPQLSVVQSGVNLYAFGAYSHTDNIAGAYYHCFKTRGTPYAMSDAQSGDATGGLQCLARAGAAWKTVTQIISWADTVSGGAVTASIRFSTCNAGSLTEKVVISGPGVVSVSNTTDATDKDTGSIVTEGGIAAELQIRAGTAITAGTTVTATTGDITASDGDVIASDNVQGATGTFGDVAGGDYSEFEADGTLVAHGDATVFDDLYIDVFPKTTGAGKPTLATFSGNINKYTFAVNDYSELGTQELLHGWEEGTEIEIHVHFAQNGLNDATARTVKFEVDYTWANTLDSGGTTAFAAATTISAEATIPAADPDKTHHYLTIGSFTPSGGKIGACLNMSIKRIASSGTEPANNPFVLMVGVHYKKDTGGSRTISAK